MKCSVMKMTILFGMLALATPALAGDINLSVAASLKDVINDLSASFTQQHTGVKFFKNFGGSGTLAKQVENGAPCDIFISANQEWLDYLKTRKLVARSGTFTYNTLVLAGIPGKKVTGMQDLAKLEKIAIGSPKSVPAGEYASGAIKKAGMDKLLEKKLVMAKDVRQCLMYAEQGEVDAAFVYRTDALLARRAKILFVVPQELYPRVVYPMAVTGAGAKNKEAEMFFEYLQSREARAVLDKYGFAMQ